MTTATGDSDDCKCPRLALGMEITEHRNWNPACPEHGTSSRWYQNGGRQRMQRRTDDVVERLRLLSVERERQRRRLQNRPSDDR